MWFHSVLIYVCLPLAMVLILRVVTSMKTNKQIENICKEHVPNVVLELSGKIPWSSRENFEKKSHVLLFLGRRRIAVNNGVDFGATPASAQMSMRSKPVTHSNGVVVRKSSIRKLPTFIERETSEYEAGLALLNERPSAEREAAGSTPGQTNT